MIQYYFGNVIGVDAGNGVTLPYSVRENAPLSAYSIIVRLINPDGSITENQQVLVLGDEQPFIYKDYQEFCEAQTFEQAVRRMFSGK